MGFIPKWLEKELKRNIKSNIWTRTMKRFYNKLAILSSKLESKVFCEL